MKMCKSILETIDDPISNYQEEDVHSPHVYANCISTYTGKDSEFSSESEGSEEQPSKDSNLKDSSLKDCYKPNNSKVICVDYPEVSAIYEKQSNYDNDLYYCTLRETEEQNKTSTTFCAKVYKSPCYFLFFLVVLCALIILSAYGVIYRKYWVFFIMFFICIVGLGAWAIKKSIERIPDY
jgi:hypothetical protein